MSSVGKLLSYIKEYPRHIVFYFLFTIIMVIFSTFSFILSEPFLKILFERTQNNIQPTEFSWDLSNIIEYAKYQLHLYVEKNGQLSALSILCVVGVTIFFLKNFFRYAANMTMSYIHYGIVMRLRNQLYHKLLNLPLAFFSNERRGDIMSRMIEDVREVQLSVVSLFTAFVKAPFLLVASLSVMLYISPQLTLFAFILIAVAGSIIGLVGKRLRKQSNEAQDKIGDLMSMIEESINGLRVIKGFNAINYKQSKFNKETNLYRKLLIILEYRRGAASPLSETLGIGMVVTLLWYGGSLVFRGDFAMESFIVFILMFYSIIEPVKSITSAYFSMQKGLGAADRIDVLLNAETAITSKPSAKPIANLKNNISYKNVGFSYDNDRQILQDINITIPKGKIIALVGPSGGGKTTLVDLLARFYDVTKGNIEIDGTDIRDYQLEDVRSLIGIVTQEPILFNDTVFNNIAFGIKNVSKADIINAAKVAHAHDFIEKMEQGYDTIIGDKGQRLSGGQRQRLTIARAVLKNPQILILDEATSALDSSSEKLVQDALLHLMQNRTSVVIAHRLSTVKHADEIIVIDEGRIVEQGTHEALLEKQGMYSKLVELQKIG